jgi:hypothetical protein
LLHSERAREKRAEREEARAERAEIAEVIEERERERQRQREQQQDPTVLWKTVLVQTTITPEPYALRRQARIHWKAKSQGHPVIYKAVSLLKVTSHYSILKVE